MSKLIFIAGFVAGDAIGAFLTIFMIAYTQKKINNNQRSEESRTISVNGSDN